MFGMIVGVMLSPRRNSGTQCGGRGEYFREM
jgi:hypothetical protein